MGYLLKEALKTLCEVYPWSYAVFWKIGCQNPNLLIWEECYYEPVTYSSLPVDAGNGVHFLVNKMMMDHQVNILGEGLVGRAAFTGNYQWILSHNYVKGAHPPQVLKEVFLQFSAGMQTIAVVPVLPHGVVQLGSYQTIMENMAFVDGVKTLILQLGSVPGVLLSENFATKEPGSKIEVPFCPENSIAGISCGRSMTTDSTPLISDSYNYKSNLTETAAYVGQTSNSVGQVLDIVHSTAATNQASNISQGVVMLHADQCQANIVYSENTNLPSTNQLTNGVVKAEVIPSNPEVWFNQQTSFCTSRSNFDQQTSLCSLEKSGTGCLSFIEQQISADIAVRNALTNSSLSDSLMMSVMSTNAGIGSCQEVVTIPPANVSEYYGVSKRNLESLSTTGPFSDATLLWNGKTSTQHTWSEFETASSSQSSLPLSKVLGNSSITKLSACSSANEYHSADNMRIRLADTGGRLENDLHQTLGSLLAEQNDNARLHECIPGHTRSGTKLEHGVQILSARDPVTEGPYTQSHAGDDLFDVLGVDLKNKLFNCGWNNSQNSGLDSNITSLDKKNSVLASDSAADSHLVNEGHSDSSIFSAMGTDHLLDAVISSIQPSAKQILDDNISCRTTLTNSSSLSLPNTSQSGSHVCMSRQIRGKLFGFPKSLGKLDILGSSSFMSGPCKESYSQSSSVYGSQISSWIEPGHDVKPSSSVSTAYSKKPDDVNKTNRKRLKPGENPRPRPKDRQMIQDRVKELREIVPNGAKCSIDALLERTIKHMIFLQSVTKHADKLKQSGESKQIIGKEGGLLIKDNYEGGATWAYEVGSQSLVCPIIVEDLNQPRQMLVEMLCEERGLFLEIADIIRGLGLTILKGIMETRNDKVWARFAVEANRDVTRMEIFMSLVRLFEQTVKKCVASGQGIDNDTVMVPQFPQDQERRLDNVMILSNCSARGVP